MSEPFVGEIRMFGGNFAPRGWAFCEGQLVAVSQNDALFSLFGTLYGGDGRTTFGLPDLRGRIPICAGTGPGLSPRRLGAKGGDEKVTLTSTQLPAHSHPLRASANSTSNADNPVDAATGDAGGVALYGVPGSEPIAMNAAAVSSVGAGQSHNNMAPVLAIHFIVALFGIYPSRQ